MLNTHRQSEHPGSQWQQHCKYRERQYRQAKPAEHCYQKKKEKKRKPSTLVLKDLTKSLSSVVANALHFRTKKKRISLYLLTLSPCFPGTLMLVRGKVKREPEASPIRISGHSPNA